jgi:hypothetical protein
MNRQIKKHESVVPVAIAWLLAAIMPFLLMGGAASAAQVSKQLTADWSYRKSDEGAIAGYRLYNQDRAVVADNVAANLRTITFTYTYDDAVAQAFHLVAVDKDGRMSDPSNTYVLSPPYRPLTGVGTFSIKITE